MGFKKIDPHFTFAPVRFSEPTGQADLALKDSMDKNRCLTRLMDIAASIDWDSIDSVLMNHYQVGGSKDGAEAYPPILLFKCLLLQKWFHPSTIFWTYGINIDSDPELESQVNDTNYLPYCTVYSRHTKQPIEKVYADKGYAGAPNREFLADNKIVDGIIRKDSTTAKLTKLEIQRNNKISKVRYIVEQYFGLSHLHDGVYPVRYSNKNPH